MFPYQYYTNMYPMYNSFSQIPRGIGNVGLLSRLRYGVNWSGLLDNTQRTLNVINQAIPVVNQVKPLFNNMKTVFKIANIMKEEPSKTSSNINYNEKKEAATNTSQPTFFL